ncbi:MAG: hypothetical protein KDB16_01175, partial [Acidimicrobiales bacterium]|nr:hypothetical protein [Acidimicrobiales bacterium]
EQGIALVTVLLGIMVIFAAVLVLAREATAQYRDARYNERDDVLLSHMEAVVDRYVSKLSVDPSYHLRWVDEFERTRTCTDPLSPDLNDKKNAGEAWFNGCGAWAYLDDPAPAEWQRHPLTVDADDGEVLLEVRPRGDRGAVELIVAGQIRQREQYRTISVDISPPAVSAFQWLSEVDLRFTPGAEVEGPVYSGNNVVFNGTPVGETRGDVYADNQILSPPDFLEGSIGYDSTGAHGGVVTDVFPEPLVFDELWDDIDLLHETACLRGGICLDEPGATAYLVQPYTLGATAQVAVWYSTERVSRGCLDPDEWWWINAEEDDDGDTNPNTNNWQVLGSFDIPQNGVLWANATVVLGNRSVGTPTGPVEIGAPLTIAAGSASDEADVVINADIEYRDPSIGDVLGLVSSGDIVINPHAVGHVTPGEMNLLGAYLAQKGQIRIARTCGQWGSVPPTVIPPHLNFHGSIATRDSGDFVLYFPSQTFEWDARFRDLAPPLYPQISAAYAFVDWRETPVPAWARL